MTQVSMDEIVSLCKRRGFIYPGSDIYGGLTGFWDYGPLGVELKNNIKKEWWKSMVHLREDVVGLDAAIVMNPEVWKASGHVDAFTDPLIECKSCHQRFRADHIIGSTSGTYYLAQGHIGHAEMTDQFGQLNVTPNRIDPAVCPNCKQRGNWTEPQTFNLLTEVYLGSTEPKTKAYLRGEITQGVFVNFKNVVDSTRVNLPFGIAQIGKAFRNEITPGNFTFRSREFEQMELEYFCLPNELEADKWFEYWKESRLNWYLKLGLKKENLRFRPHADDERAHYARKAEDIEYRSPFGWKEFEGIHHRGDWDLTRHRFTGLGEYGIPWVIETSGGVDRATLFFIIDAYERIGERVILKLHPKIAPIKAAIFPLVSNKPEIVGKAQTVFKNLRQSSIYVAWDDRGNIGKRYYAQDEIGTPWCITVDYQTLEDDTVTIRDRDTANQIRSPIAQLDSYFADHLK